ncbi:MAG: type VI secretion system membrane subunit TssM [Chromatiaceae bacterium]|nr:type VI secretion system membrane subunit TssM [Chromatiaceae bacterium]
MKGPFRFLLSAWFLSLLGVVALALLVWFVGPLLGFADRTPLSSPFVRGWVIGGLFGVWGLVQLVFALVARGLNRKLVDQLSGADAPSDDEREASEEELETMRRRFADAMDVLRRGEVRRRLGGQWLYQLPWYLIIGPPGCGKTTALVNSGLRFPLAEEFGENAIQGTGGTRNCDWWFTDEAVLLDTAGRYTTQDSYAEVDRAAWSGFLGLLKKYRPRRPINGVLVALSLSDLMQQTDAERDLHAKAVRARVQELYTELRIRCPIYVVFTKADLVAGFSEFFADLGQEDRQQVWGFSFPLDVGNSAAPPLKAFADEYQALVERLDERLLGRLQQERDAGKRRLVFSFPRQFASLGESISSFLDKAFGPSRFEQRPLVRGVYFTSGTQTGTPIDRVLGAIAASFGVGRDAPPPFTGTAKSFFVTRLLRDLVFAEAAVAGLDPRLERRRLWLRRGAFATLAAVALLGAAAWTTSYSRNRAYVADISAQVVDIQRQIDALSPEEHNPLSVLPLLNELRAIPGGYADQGKPVPWSMGLGLYQGDKLGSQANLAYQRALQRALLPRVMLRLEDQIHAAATDPESVYEGLRVYLMLDDARCDSVDCYDAESVQRWITDDWRRRLPRDTTEEQHAALAEHLQALLREQPAPLPLALDEALIQDARDILKPGQLAQQIYSRLQREGVDERIPDFSIPSAGGDLATLVLTRPSGKSMTQGIPALYTYQGYHESFNDATNRLIRAAADNAWVLGPKTQLEPGSPRAEALLEDVRERYLLDYADQWNALLEDIGLVEARDIQHAAEITRILADPKESPLRRLLTAAAAETELDREPSGNGSSADTGGSSGADVEPPELYVSRRFAWLRDLVRADGDQSAPFDRLQQQLAQLRLHLSSIASAQLSGRSILAAGDGKEVQQVQQAAAQLPGPVAGLVTSLAQDSETLIAGGARADIKKQWASKVLPFCREAIGDRYPLSKGSRRDTTLQDFGRLFGPGGLLETFFADHLAAIVDTSSRNWRWIGSGIGIPDEVLAQFQRAAVIREAFFGGGGKLPAVAFELVPTNLDSRATQFTLDLGGQVLDYRHGPIRPQSMTWPPPQGIGRARMAFVDLDGRETGATEDGAWAWFRLLDRARLRATGQEELFRVTFSLAGLSARFDLRAASVRNPFQLDELRSFRCPERL